MNNTQFESDLFSEPIFLSYANLNFASFNIFTLRPHQSNTKISPLLRIKYCSHEDTVPTCSIIVVISSDPLVRFMETVHFNTHHVGFEVFTAVVIKRIIFWDVTPCSLLRCNRRFWGTDYTASHPRKWYSSIHTMFQHDNRANLKCLQSLKSTRLAILTL
jgi:hypothetical protein